MNSNESVDQGRRQALAAIGAAGLALAAGGMLTRETSAQSVQAAVYGPGAEDEMRCGCRGGVSACDYGAIGDGLSHPLSEFYATLPQAQLDYPHAASLSDEMDWAAIQKALDTEKNVYVPDGNYRINRPIAIRVMGQALYSYGTYTTTLTWNGTNPAHNMIEILSTRRDTGNGGTYRAGQRLYGFLLTSTTDGVMANAIWMEAGVFHAIVEKLRIIMPGRPTGAIIRTASGGGTSYVNGPTFRDITITGQINASGLPIPVGVWAEGIIEGYFDSVRVFSTEIGWRFGSPVANDSRNVSDCTFVRCHSEIGNRANGTDAGVAVQFYQGINMNFYGCKFTCGADFTVPNGQRVVTFANSDGAMGRSINFDSTSFWQINATGAAIQFLASALYKDVHFNNPSLDCPVGILSIDPMTDVNLTWQNPTYSSTVPKTAEFRTRGTTFPAATIADGAFHTVTLPEFQLPRGVPFLLSYSGDLQGAILTGYRTSGFANGTASLQNATWAAISLAAGRLRWREFAPDERKARLIAAFDPPSLPAGASYAVTFTCPGAELGDFVEAGLPIDSTGGLRSMILKAYVSAPGTVTVRLTNLTTVTSNFPSRDLIIDVLAPKFGAYRAISATPGVIPDGGGMSVAVAVPGVEPGDFAVASFSHDLQGVMAGANVSASGTVTVRLQNGTGAAVELPAGTLAVGVYKRYSAM